MDEEIKPQTADSDDTKEKEPAQPEEPVDPEPEAAETAITGDLADQMTGSALVAAETLKDAPAKADDTKKDDAPASSDADKKDSDEKTETIKAVVTDDGELFLKLESGASSLAASAVALIALSSIIY